jgi:uncharacterized protein (UPF0332 family)
MTIFSKQHYELIEMFDREFKGEGRLDKEAKEYWPKGQVYQDGMMNRLFAAYRRGYAFGTAVSA